MIQLLGGPCIFQQTPPYVYSIPTLHTDLLLGKLPKNAVVRELLGRLLHAGAVADFDEALLRVTGDDRHEAAFLLLVVDGAAADGDLDDGENGVKSEL